MTREQYGLLLLFFLLGCAILSALYELIYVSGKMRVVLVKATEGGKVLEGEFSPVEGEEK